MRRKVLKTIAAIAATNSFSISDKFADTSFEVEFEEFIMGLRNM
jgi:hypothetical protein